MLSRPRWTTCAPAMFGYVVPAGGSAWQEVQSRSVSGDPPVWHVVHRGAEEIGEVPVTAWQEAHPAGNGSLNVAPVTPVWARNGTAWATGPLAWHDAATPSALVNDAEKQLGAAGFGPAPGPSSLWQIVHAVVMLPALRWEAVYGWNPVWGSSNQVVGWASAAVWQVEHLVGAEPPSKRIVPGVPWHVWQNERSCLAESPWKAELGIVQVLPSAWGASSAM